MVYKRNAHRILVGKPDGMRPLDKVSHSRVCGASSSRHPLVFVAKLDTDDKLQLQGILSTENKQY
jgi:hypothetical protein